MENENLGFIGRTRELDYLASALRTKTASLIVVKGRRRVGKSRLIEEFARGHKFYRFTGLAPDKQKVTPQSQRDQFAFQLNQQTGLPEIKTDDWNKLFALLNERLHQGRVIVLLDEITWMGSEDPTFLSKLHSAWENYYKSNPELILVICGSVSGWIEKNILSSTGYFGRVSIKLTLEELPIRDCHHLMNKLGFKGSIYERFMLLAVMGGIPWYVEQIDPALSAAENIKRLCFTKDGLLVDEFKKIFHDLFGEARSITQSKIVTALAKGALEYDQISKETGYPSGGSLSEYLEELLVSGFVERDFTWLLKSGKSSALSKYRLRDNYLRFYLKYIAPKLDRINKQQYTDVALTALPGLESIIGLQLESIVLNNRRLIQQALHIDPSHIINDNPFFQSKTTKQRGCQIDYLIQTRFKTLYVCEIKFSTNEVGSDVIDNVKEKIARLNLPRGFTCLPVLIVVSGVKKSVLEKNYFVKIIDMKGLLTGAL